MSSSSVLNVCLILGILGLAVDASANLISCNKAKLKWVDPIKECEQNLLKGKDAANFFPGKQNLNVSLDASESFFINKDDLKNAQFVSASLTNNELIDLCLNNDDCHKGGASLTRFNKHGAIVRVSEPAPMLLVILGILGLGLVRRRSR